MEEKNYSKRDLSKKYWKGFWNATESIAVAGLLVGGVYFSTILKKEPTLVDYKNAHWIKSNVVPWKAYMKENILHNSKNWAIYQEEVREKNKKIKKLNPLEKSTYYPDLDHNGKVGK